MTSQTVTTQAVLTQSDGSSQLQEINLDPLTDGALILALEGCGLCGTDLFKIQQRRSTPALPAPAAPGPAPEPIVLGHELVGRIVAKGPNAPFEVGQRLVVAHHVPCGRCRLCEFGAETSCPSYKENLLRPGGFSNHVLIDARAAENSAFPVPESLTTERAIFLEPTACVLRGIAQAKLPKTPRISIFGGGSMGLLHLLTIRALHPKATITVVEPNPERRAIAQTLGATRISSALDHSVDPSTASCDAAFDTVGLDEVLPLALSTLRPGGTAVLFAHGTAHQTSHFSSNQFFRAEHRIVATYSSGRLDQVKAFELLCSGTFEPEVLVTNRMPLDQFERAVQLSENHQVLKILLTPADPSAHNPSEASRDSP